MEAWLAIVIRQITLYILPIIISLTVVSFIESQLTKKASPHAFFSFTSKATWWPFLASIAFTRGIIFALPQTSSGLYATWIRFLAHLILCIVGFAIYAWALTHQAPTGLPPLHHWWAKILMYFNLCMLGIHLLPLPNLLMGELLARYTAKNLALQWWMRWLNNQRALWMITLLAASPLIDIIIGGSIVFPIYKQLAMMATRF